MPVNTEPLHFIGDPARFLTGVASKERYRIVKNVVMLGLAFMIHFTAFHGTSNLQSSVNADAALGTFTLASIYGSLILSNIFLPVVVIGWLGCKWTVALSFIAYMPFIGAQFFPRFYTMIPAGLMVGFGGGPLWCAKCTYLTVASEAYAQLAGMKSDVVVVRFFGLFFMFYQMAQVWGNLISSAVLTSLEDYEVSFVAKNTSEAFIEHVGDICGTNFCPGVSAETNPNLKPPEERKIQLMAGIFLACMIGACLIVAFGVDSLQRYDKGRKGSGAGLSGFRLLAVTMKQLGHKYQLLLLPITMFIGAEQAFVAADYNVSFVACAWGIGNIGYVMICFGVANAIAALLGGGLIKLTGRYPVMLCATVLHGGLLLFMATWRPRPDSPVMFCAIAALWGIADAIWLVQVNSLSGILFPGKEEAAYSNFRLWEATGSVIAYAYSPYLCTSVKLYLLLGLLGLGMLGYTMIELSERKVKNTNNKKQFELVDAQRADSAEMTMTR